MYRIFLLFVTVVSIIHINDGTPLDDYVYKPDLVFTWQLIQTNPSSTYTVYILNMTSQKWFDESFSSQSIWWHYMIITVPKEITRPNTAFMLIAGGNNNDPMPTGSSTTALALESGSVAVEVQQVPNQPITFAADPLKQNRSEDAIVSWTWNTFIESNGSHPAVLLQLPMTKAAVRAMETTQEFLYEKEIPVPDKFVVSGFSKRGWATAVDGSRVTGAIPIVLDILNLQKNMKHHYQSLAGWTFAFADYYMQNITRNLDNPFFQVMANIIDPYTYFDRYRYIKLCQFQGADDEFFLPDSEDYFWDDLQKATHGSYLRRIPNVGHALTGFEESLGSFYRSVSDQQTLPSFTFTRTTNATYGEIRTNVSIGDGHPAPINVTVYQARTVTGTKRDFRQAKLDPTTKQVIPNPVKWVEMKDNIETSKIGESIIYTYAAPMPPAGQWDGIFMQLTFPGPDNTTLILTTETLTIPDTFPLGPCSGEQCYGTLV